MEQYHLFDAVGQLNPDLVQDPFGLDEPKASESAEHIAGTYHATPGVSLDLGVRATAIASALNAYNGLSMSGGLEKASKSDDVKKDLGRRYRNPDKVVAGNIAKRPQWNAVVQHSIDQIVMVDEMLAAGFNESDANVARTTVQYEVRTQFGPGNSNAAARKKEIDTVIKTNLNSQH